MTPARPSTLTEAIDRANDEHHHRERLDPARATQERAARGEAPVDTAKRRRWELARRVLG